VGEIDAWRRHCTGVLAIFVGLGELLVAHPILGPVYLAAFATLGVLAMWFVWRGQPRRAFWCAFATILVDFLFSRGDDTFTHIYRITALAEQVRDGCSASSWSTRRPARRCRSSSYNVLPYVIPTVLNLAGPPAFYAFKLLMCGHFVGMHQWHHPAARRVRDRSGAGAAAPGALVTVSEARVDRLLWLRNAGARGRTVDRLADRTV
jgi:hypothetical protein